MATPQQTQTVQLMIKRLRELQGINEQIPMSRKVTAGTGLSGGGTLERDVTLSLSESYRKTITDLQAVGAISSLVTDSALREILASYTKTVALPKPVVNHDFTVMEAPASKVVAPPVMVTHKAVLRRVDVTIGAPGSQAVKVIIGGVACTVPAGSTSKTFGINQTKEAGATIPLSVDPTDAASILVSIRLEEI